MDFFEDFTQETVALDDGPVRLRHGGEGPPLLLLHGNPQTHLMWHAVAPELSRHFTVICPDLRGYGQSFKPPASPDHAPYAKREMAKDMVAVMAHFGFSRFHMAGHDRGGRVGHRLALDHPERVQKFAILDIVPTIEHFERTDMAFALGYYHWFWFAQAHPFPENLINAAPDIWFDAHTKRATGEAGFFHTKALEDYLAAARDPAAITGMCEDYRAAATIDLVHDRESREAGLKLRCPVMVLWGSRNKIGVWYDPIALWQTYAHEPVQGGPIDCGHYLPEEAPGETLGKLLAFFGSQDGG